MNMPDLPLPRRSLLAMLPALLTACSGVDLLNATVSTDTYRLTQGLAYGQLERQLLDVYQPRAEVVKPPLVVFLWR